MRGRRVRVNHRTEVPSAHIAIDTETKDDGTGEPGTRVNRLVVGRAVYWRRERGQIRARQTFEWVENCDLWRWLGERLSAHRPTWVWAHNLGFDAPIFDLFRELDKGTLTRKFAAFDAEICLFSGHYEGRKVSFVDTYHWTGKSVEEMGEWLDFPKLKIDLATCSPAELETYCQRDVEIVERAVNRICDLVQTLDLGCLRYTAASQAYQHWKHLEGRPEVYLPSRQSEAALARDCLYGGRVYTPFIGARTGPIYDLDVNGAYGHALGTGLMPVRHIDSGDPCGQSDLWERFDPLRCAACVDLDTKHPYPVWHTPGGLLWAVGRFTTCLPGPELADAVKRGVVRRVRFLSVYELGQPCQAFADWWWSKRMEYRAAGDKVLENVAKLMPCRLYGKLAQLSPRWISAGPLGGDQRWGACPYYDESTRRWHPGRVVSGEWEYDCSRAYEHDPGSIGLRCVTGTRSLPRPETEGSFPAISAWTTSYIRLLMDHFRDVAEYGNCYYQCVDSLHVNQAGYDRLEAAGCIDPNRRGALKIKPKDGRPYQEVHYHGTNLLRIDGRLKAAGLPGIHQEKEAGVCESTTFERLDSILHRGPDGSVHIRDRQWKLSEHQYAKDPTDSGWLDLPRLPLD